MTDSNRMAHTALFRVKPKVEQKRGRLVVMPDKVAHQGSVDIGVERDVAHRYTG